MRTALLTIVLAVCLVITPGAKTNPFNSIRPLMTEIAADESQDTHRQVICTAWATRFEDKPAWVTAAHCVVSFADDAQPGDLNQKLWVGDVKVTPVVVNFTEDIAVLRGGPKADPFVISFKEAQPDDDIWSAGYPMGASVLHYVRGVFSVKADDGDGKSIYNLSVAPGMSGAPIVDKKSGAVIGLMQQTECPKFVNWCSISRGAPLPTLREVLKIAVE